MTYVQEVYGQENAWRILDSYLNCDHIVVEKFDVKCIKEEKSIFIPSPTAIFRRFRVEITYHDKTEEQ